MKVSIYCRVSTVDQSVEMQRSDLRRYCEQRSFEIFREYVDEGVSGTKDRRPALDALMEDARKRLFDGVVCWRFDRFARSTKHLISALDEFQHLGVEFISYQENIRSWRPLPNWNETSSWSVSEAESGARENRAREQGTRLGRRPFTDPSLLRTVLQIKAQGRSIRAIAETVKVSKSFVHKTCKNSGPQTLEIPAGQN